MTGPARSPWLPSSAGTSPAPVRLFCLPYACGNATIFRDWPAGLDGVAEVVPVLLPGRLDRLAEPAISRADVLAGQLAEHLVPLLDRPFALFGASMGALLAFETARRLTAAGHPPARLVVASYRAPRHPASGRRVHELPAPELVRVLRTLNATPPELLTDDAFVRLMLPTIRADFAVTETYRYEPGEPIPVPITVVRGRDDRSATAANVRAWDRESTHPVELVDLPGGHFFLTEDAAPLLAVLRDRLRFAPRQPDASQKGSSAMTDLNDRLSALSPRQRMLLRRRLGHQEAPAGPLPAGDRTETPEPAGRDLRWSLFFFASGESGSTRRQYELLLDCARFADRRGFDAIWLPERHFDPFGAPYPSPSVLAAAVAAVTERLEVRAGSVVLPLHDPIRVAEEWAVVDNLSGGRVGISFASGWHANDFVLAPDAFQSRKAVLADKLARFRTLWTGAPVSRVDGAGNEVEVRTFPTPVRADVPLWLTSSSRVETWLAAARERLNVLTGLMEQTTDELAGKVAAYQAELRAHGAEVRDRAVTTMLHTFVGETDAEVRSTVHGPLVRYLRSHMELFAKLARSTDVGIDPDRFSEADKQALAELAFERYFTTHGLFGTPDSAMPTVDRLRAAGVTEIACLVDFGIAPDTVLRHLDHLDHLRARSLAPAGAGLTSAGGAAA